MNRRRVDHHRRRRGPEGPLTLLYSQGRGEYEALFSIVDDWGAWYERDEEGTDKVPILLCEIDLTDDAERTAAILAALDGTAETPAATDIAVEGSVFKLELEHTKRPLGEPRRWKLRAYYTEGKWTNG
ncbi:MAG TPA: hypothetical protein VIP46_22650 [Pyrinomonadaceae bacterium]